MLVEISGDRIVNPLSDNIIGIFPSKNIYRGESDKLPPYFLHIGCQDGIECYPITKEDRNIILNAMQNRMK